MSLDVPGPDGRGEFEPDEEGWARVFGKVDSTIRESGLENAFHPCLHLAPDIAPLLANLNLVGEFRAARARREEAGPVGLGNHARHADHELVTTPGFAQAVRDDLHHATLLGASILVEHPPVGEADSTRGAVDVLASDWFCDLMDQHPSVTIAWENKADYAEKRRFFGSLDRMLGFREALVDRLLEAGRGGLIGRHKFCFDTGHLLVWLGTSGSSAGALREIDRCLPAFAANTIAFHFQANDGVIDGHVTPFSTAFFDHPTRTRMDLDKLRANFELVRQWIRVCQETPHEPGRHLYLEAGTLPFSLAQYVEFGRELARLSRP
ncbi:MAG: hypothetical protein JW839_22205 [Candidatus Lokiarchaeota archaeon]|nr:hypothetical protein [Candidatus Lokiarchaeota archaeon]